MKELSRATMRPVIQGAVGYVLRNQLARLICWLIFFSVLIHVTDRVSYLYANQSRAPYKIVSVEQTPLVTLVDAELHQVASVPDMKAFGDSIRARQARDGHIMIQFFDGHRSEDTLLCSYQDGQVYLVGSWHQDHPE